MSASRGLDTTLEESIIVVRGLEDRVTVLELGLRRAVYNITEVQSAIRNVSTDATIQRSDIIGLRGGLGALESQVHTIQNLLPTFIGRSEFSGLSSNVTSVTDSLNGLRSSIALLSNKLNSVELN